MAGAYLHVLMSSERVDRYTMSIDASQLKGKLQIRDLAWQRGISVTGWRREFENGLVPCEFISEYAGVQRDSRISSDTGHTGSRA
jgi:hypothetical protein